MIPWGVIDTLRGRRVLGSVPVGVLPGRVVGREAIEEGWDMADEVSVGIDFGTSTTLVASHAVGAAHRTATLWR